MEILAHTIDNLFAQLGLPNSHADIEQFISRHALKPTEKLHEAHFWSEQQSRLIREMWKADSDWCGVIDELDARLHH
jgi:hypothetical protein